jgi:hypothetical protein
MYELDCDQLKTMMELLDITTYMPLMKRQLGQFHLGQWENGPRWQPGGTTQSRRGRC